MYGINYVWILHGYHQNNWWKYVENTNCSVEEIESVLQGHFALAFAPQRPDSNKAITSNKVVILALFLINVSLPFRRSKKLRKSSKHFVIEEDVNMMLTAHTPMMEFGLLHLLSIPLYKQCMTFPLI